MQETGNEMLHSLEEIEHSLNVETQPRDIDADAASAAHAAPGASPNGFLVFSPSAFLVFSPGGFLVF